MASVPLSPPGGGTGRHTMGIERVALRALFLAGAAAVSATPAWAQNRGDATEETESAAPAAASPEIVVVGTRIEGAKTTGALPVTVLGEDRIAAVGSVSGDDLFRSIPQAGDVNFQEARTTGSGTGMLGVTDQKKKEVRRMEGRERRSEQMARNRGQLHISKQANHQKYYNYQIL